MRAPSYTADKHVVKSHCIVITLHAMPSAYRGLIELELTHKTCTSRSGRSWIIRRILDQTQDSRPLPPVRLLVSEL